MQMRFSLIPQPQSVRFGRGAIRIPRVGTVFIADGCFHDAAQEACCFLGDYVVTTVSSVRSKVSFLRRAALPREGYVLDVGRDGIVLEAGSAEGAFWGVQTLRQVVAQANGKRLPALVVKDWPDFSVRGLYCDVSRGRVPKMEMLMKMAERLSRYKVNQLQLYIEHTFLFHGHPEIGRGVSPLTSEDILELDEFCRDRHIELVPSLASFGHMQGILRLQRYRHLAEDWGVGKYVSPEAGRLPEWQRRTAWSLSPANPATYVFLDSLFGEFLPLFSSGKFNVCCDETWDLGLGQSYELCRKKGKGRVYLDHILKLRELAAKYGKKIMFWGDIIRKYPELLKKIPGDVTLLDWGYDHNHPFSRVKDFRKAGLPFYVCPGTGSWNSLFPRLHEAAANIHGFAVAGKKNKADGLLNTDWGDGGHYNFMELSWPGYLFGAEQAWNVGADRKTFVRRFCSEFLCSLSRKLAAAIVELGDISQLQVRKNRNIWQEIFFAVPDDAVFSKDSHKGWISNNGRISTAGVRLDAALGRRTLARLEKIRKVLTARYRDPMGILPYWIFAVDTMIHSARKLTVLGHAGRDTASGRRILREQLKVLLRRFKSLWLARNRASEISITLGRYQKVIDAL
jgi:hypothetical protein